MINYLYDQAVAGATVDEQANKLRDSKVPTSHEISLGYGWQKCTLTEIDLDEYQGPVGNYRISKNFDRYGNLTPEASRWYFHGEDPTPEELDLIECTYCHGEGEVCIDSAYIDSGYWEICENCNGEGFIDA